LKKTLFLTFILSSILNADFFNIIDKVSNQINSSKSESKIDEWFNLKLSQIEKNFNNEYIISVSKEIHRIDETKLDKFTTQMNKVLDYNYKVTNMKKNREYYDMLYLTIDDFKDTKNYIDKLFNSFNIEFSDNFQPYKIFQYQKENNLESINQNILASYKLKKMFFEKYPKQINYSSYINTVTKKIEDLAFEIGNYSFTFEQNEFIKKVSLKYKYISNVQDESLGKTIRYKNFNPNKNSIYRISEMEVFQNTKDGFLAKSIYDQYSKNIVFIKSNELFVDKKQFQDEGYYLIYDGLTQYQSLTGTKTVYQFSMLKNEGTYYFFY